MKFGSDYRALAHHWVYNDDYSECYGNRMFSENDVIYSYGRHFAIARKIKTDSGEIIFLFNSDGYSQTTTKQKYAVYGAIPKYSTIFEVPNAELNHEKNIQHFIEKLENNCIKESRAKTIDYKPYVRNALVTLQEYIELFPQDKRKFTKTLKQLIDFKCDENSDINVIVELLTGIVNERARIEKKKAKIASKKAIEQAKEGLKAWKNFETDNTWQIRHLDKNFLRYNSDKKIIEVSNSANISEEEALIFYNKVERGIKLLGEHVGNFTVVKATDTFTIGCTKLERDELNYICNKLNLKEIF